MNRISELLLSLIAGLGALYFVFAFGACVYGWSIDGVNPGNWESDTRGAFVGIYILFICFSAIICGARDRGKS